MADKPFRIKFCGYTGTPDAQIAAHLEHAKSYPREGRGLHLHPVAVVGGGPSVARRLDELRQWPGEIWAVNSTADWLADRGIGSTLFSCDHSHIPSRAKKAVLASCCHPAMFEGREVRVFDMSDDAPDGVIGGNTTASRAPVLALKLGYPGVAFFGCDSSFETSDHVDRNDQFPKQVIVHANGADYRTYPDFLVQAECLADLVRGFGGYLVNKSDGLLAAMVADAGWEVVAVSAALRESLNATNGDEGIYDEPYVASV
jgi:hypothetical protein